MTKYYALHHGNIYYSKYASCENISLRSNYPQRVGQAAEYLERQKRHVWGGYDQYFNLPL